ncbi:MAG: hypothetical protein IPJ23_08775 [Ignavibacteriales bacterium]|nr:hypothetical protein [Ignavibacteriales bacterium]
MEENIDNPNVADSLHGPLFVPIQKLNENIQTIGKILTHLKSVKVIHTSDYPNKQKEIAQSLFKNNLSNSLIKQITNNEESNIDPKLLIGVFEEMNNTASGGNYLMIVNKDVGKGSNITVALNSPYRIFKFDKDNGESILIASSDKISLQISPGSGELLYIR